MASEKVRLTAEPERANPIAPAHLWRSPASAETEVLVITDLNVYADLCGSGQAALPNETGGFLLGRVWWDARTRVWIVFVEEAVPVDPLTQTPVHFSFSWRDVDRVRGQRESQGKALVGWYHTHPDMGIFLSETDVEKTHRVLFSEPFQIALVYDPIRGRAGYFFWEGAQVIDASRAPWREFQIVMDEGQPTPETLETPVEIVLNPQNVPAPPPVSRFRESGTPIPDLVGRFQQAAQSASASVPAEPQSAQDMGVGPSVKAAAEGRESPSLPVPLQSRLLVDEARLHPDGVNASPALEPQPRRWMGLTVGLGFVVLAALAAFVYWMLRR